MLSGDQLIALAHLHMDIEAPQPMQVLEHLASGVAQWFAIVLLVAQGQRAVATAVEVLPLPLNDNLTIPVISGGVMELIARTAGFS